MNIQYVSIHLLKLHKISLIDFSVYLLYNLYLPLAHYLPEYTDWQAQFKINEIKQEWCAFLELI